MNQTKKNRKLDEYKAVVLDLDGTLYYQKPFRMRMVRFLASPKPPIPKLQYLNARLS